MKTSKWLVLGFWISTALFALQMSFTAYAQLRLPQVAQAFARLGFPAYFRIELSCAKLAGVAILLVPMVPARLKEGAYAGFAITLVSALIAPPVLSHYCTDLLPCFPHPLILHRKAIRNFK